VSAAGFELIGRAGCGLCEEMGEALRAALGAHGSAPPLLERDVADDPERLRRFGRHLPVLLLHGAILCAHRLDGARLARALAGERWEPLELD